MLVTRTLDSNTDPDCSRDINPDMDLSCSSGPDITMASGSSAGLAGLHALDVACPLNTNMDSGGYLTLGIHMALGGNIGHDFNTDPGYNRTTHPDMTLGSIQGLDVTRWRHRPLRSVWFCLQHRPPDSFEDIGPPCGPL